MVFLMLTVVMQGLQKVLLQMACLPDSHQCQCTKGRMLA